MWSETYFYKHISSETYFIQKYLSRGFCQRKYFLTLKTILSIHTFYYFPLKYGPDEVFSIKLCPCWNTIRMNYVRLKYFSDKIISSEICLDDIFSGQNTFLAAYFWDTTIYFRRYCNNFTRHTRSVQVWFW